MNKNKKAGRYKYRTEEDKRALVTRLNVIEGQVRGVTQMLENDRNCEEMLVQISAIKHSLESVATELFKIHLSTYVIEEVKNNNPEIVDEILFLSDRLNK